jgi:hypothetical protein
VTAHEYVSQPHCRECKKAYDAAYYATHREERKAYIRANRARIREEKKAYDAAYYATHREERKAYDAAYRDTIAGIISRDKSNTKSRASERGNR